MKRARLQRGFVKARSTPDWGDALDFVGPRVRTASWSWLLLLAGLTAAAWIWPLVRQSDDDLLRAQMDLKRLERAAHRQVLLAKASAQAATASGAASRQGAAAFGRDGQDHVGHHGPVARQQGAVGSDRAPQRPGFARRQAQRFAGMGRQPFARPGFAAQQRVRAGMPPQFALHELQCRFAPVGGDCTPHLGRAAIAEQLDGAPIA